jgi:AAA domain
VFHPVNHLINAQASKGKIMSPLIDYDRSLGLDVVAADRSAVCKQLEFMFGGLDQTQYAGGKIEVGSPGGECRFFGLNEFDSISEYVVERTLRREKTYIHAGLIRPDGEKVLKAALGAPAGHSKSTDVMCWPVLWGEADHANLEYDRNLKGKARFLARLQAFRKAATWGFVYATGIVPTLRMQGLIRLQDPAAPSDAQFWSVLKSITTNGRLDAGANNSSQLLRLAGSVSFASGDQKAAEAGEDFRVTEQVKIIKDDGNKSIINLGALYVHLSLEGKLIQASHKGKLRSAKNIAELMSRIKRPDHVEDLDADETVSFVQHQVAKACALEGGGEVNRRNGVLASAKVIGGLLWTEHFEPQDIIGDDEDWSLVEAYHTNGGAADNGENDIAKGILDAMMSGAAQPLRTIGRRITADAFGAVDEEPDGDELATENCLSVQSDVEISPSKVGQLKSPRHPKTELDIYKAAKKAYFQSSIRSNAGDGGLTSALEGIESLTFDDDLIRNVIPAMSLVAFIGNANAGKTFLLLAVLKAVAANLTFNGHDVDQGGALYVGSEGREKFARRRAALYRAMDKDEAKSLGQNSSHYGIATAFDFTFEFPFGMEPENACARLYRLAVDFKLKNGSFPAIIGVDHMLALQPKNAIGFDWQNVLSNELRVLKDVVGCTVVILIHENRAGGYFGAMAQRASWDRALHIVEEVKTTGKKPEIKKTLTGRRFINDDKNRDGPKQGEVDSFTLVSRLLGHTPKNHAVSSAIVRFGGMVTIDLNTVDGDSDDDAVPTAVERDPVFVKDDGKTVHRAKQLAQALVENNEVCAPGDDPGFGEYTWRQMLDILDKFRMDRCVGSDKKPLRPLVPKGGSKERFNRVVKLAQDEQWLHFDPVLKKYRMKFGFKGLN